MIIPKVAGKKRYSTPGPPWRICSSFCSSLHDHLFKTLLIYNVLLIYHIFYFSNTIIYINSIISSTPDAIISQNRQRQWKILHTYKQSTHTTVVSSFLPSFPNIIPEPLSIYLPTTEASPQSDSLSSFPFHFQHPPWLF